MIQVQAVIQQASGPALRDYLKTIGVSLANFRAVNQGGLWLPNQRMVVRQTLDSLIFGTLDTMGLPHFTVSAELVAAWIAATVKPVNWMPACHWYDGVQLAQQLLRDPSVGREADTHITSVPLRAQAILIHVERACEAICAEHEITADTWHHDLANSLKPPSAS